MPVTRSAIKKLKQDQKRSQTNLLLRKRVKNVIKKFKRSPTDNLLNQVYSVLDTAKKKRIFPKNKVYRLKSRLSNIIVKKAVKITQKKKPLSKRKKS